MLPAINAEKKKTEMTELSPIQRGTETVLVADDNEAVRRLSREILEQSGYTVIEAADGQTAVDTFLENREQIDLLLLDLVMPEKNGKDVYKEIRGIDPDVKIVFLSGHTEDLSDLEKIEGEKISIIFKPVAISDLIGKVRDVLNT